MRRRRADTVREVAPIVPAVAAGNTLVGQDVVAWYRHGWEDIADDIKRDLGADRHRTYRVEFGFEDFPPSGPSLARDLVLVGCEYLPEARREEILWRVVDQLPPAHPKKLGRALREEAQRHGRSFTEERRRRLAAAVPFAISGVPGRRPLPPVITTEAWRFPDEAVVLDGLRTLVRRWFLWRDIEGRRKPPDLTTPDLIEQSLMVSSLDEEDALRAWLERVQFSRREQEALRAMARGAEKPADLVRLLGWTPGYARQVVHSIRQKADRRR